MHTVINNNKKIEKKTFVYMMSFVDGEKKGKFFNNKKKTKFNKVNASNLSD